MTRIRRGGDNLFRNEWHVRRRLLLLLPILLCGVVFSQNGNGRTSYKLLSIHVKGLNRFTEGQIIGASGLKLGQFAGEEDFKQALQKLGETGLFSNLAYSYHYSDTGCDLEMQVAEEEKLVPPLFDNFVWFSDQELIDLLHGRVPLFDGRLPLGGNLAAQVSTALNAILAERKIAGQAEYFEYAEVNGPITAYLYKLTFHSVIIRNADFPGAAPSEIPALQTAAKQVPGEDYLRSAMRVQEQLSLLPVYRARGYLKAAFSEPRATVVQDGAQTQVDVSFPVTPGTQYKVSSFELGGYRVFRVEEIRSLIQLKEGEPANAVQLDDDIRMIQKLYGTKGYLEAQVRAQPRMDDEAATVRYYLEVLEGDQYHMGDLKIDGLPEDATKQLIAQWRIKKGDAFDNSYLTSFFKTMYADAQLGRSYNVIPKQSVNAQNKTADVYLHFVPKN